MGLSFFSRMAVGLAGAVAALIGSGHVAVAEMVPHRAVYSLTMGKGDTSGRFVNVGGAVKMVLEKTCDAWIIVEQINMHIDTQVGGRLLQDLKYTGWESLDGRQYRFAAHSRINNESKKFMGKARSDLNQPGEAVYSKPKKMKMVLPPGTRFYFGLTSWLIERARSGATRAETVVFDGTDEEGPQRAVAFIIALEKNSGAVDNGLGPLVDRPGWSMRIAFYPIDGRGAAPDYEVQAVILDNGVAPKMELVFTNFTAIQKLEKIEALELPKC